MLPKLKARKQPVEPFVARNSGWVRAPDSGFVIHKKQLGDRVVENEVLAEIKKPLGDVTAQVLSNADGIIIGKQNIPLVQEGEAVYHIAYFNKPGKVEASIENMQEKFE
jgi:predicted deacylase